MYYDYEEDDRQFPGGGQQGMPTSPPPGFGLQGGFGGQGGFPGGFPGGQPGGFPGGQSGGFPGGQSGGFPGGPGGGQPSTFAVDPGAIQRCLYRNTFVQLRNGQRFWYFPTFIGRHSIAGYRWFGLRWAYFGIDLNQITSFRC